MAAVQTCPSDGKDDEWAFVAPYPCLVREDAPQRDYALRDVFNALRYLAHTGCPWRYLPHDWRCASNAPISGANACAACAKAQSSPSSAT